MVFPHTNLDGNLSPLNWLRQETSHPLALSLFTNENLSNDQNMPSLFFIEIYKFSNIYMGLIPSKRCNPTLVGNIFQRIPLAQQFLVSHFHQIPCGRILADLNPLSAPLELFLALECHICQM